MYVICLGILLQNGQLPEFDIWAFIYFPRNLGLVYFVLIRVLLSYLLKLLHQQFHLRKSIHVFYYFDVHPPILSCFFVEPIYFDDIFWKTVEFHSYVFVLCQYNSGGRKFWYIMPWFFSQNWHYDVEKEKITVPKSAVSVPQFPGCCISPSAYC